MTRLGRSATLVLFALAIALPGRTLAQSAGGTGAQTGDGSNAFTGLATAPEANLFAGASSTTIPIEVSPGRKNLTPKIQLAYSSSGGPSPYGYGWDLPLGRIQRSTKHGVLSCVDPKYRNDFVVVLPSASVECTLQPDNSCRPRIEEAFLKITYDATNLKWVVWDRSGLRYEFGSDPSARLGSTPSGALFDPSAAPCQYTHAWMLNHIDDPNTNHVDYVYSQVDGVAYPEEIQYGGNYAGALGHPFQVKFVWSDEEGFGRPAGDDLINSIGGFPARVTRLLSRIEMRYPVNGPRVRWYSFNYEFQVGADRIGRQSFLSGVTLMNDNDEALTRADSNPATTIFEYHRNEPAGGRFGFASAPQSPSKPTAIVNSEWPGILRVSNGSLSYRDAFDINGDGFVDLVDSRRVNAAGCGATGVDYWDVYLGSVDGFAGTATPWYVPQRNTQCYIRVSAPVGGAGNTATYRGVVDINGDGIPDFVDAGTVPWQVYVGKASVSYATGQWGFENAQSWTEPDPDTYLPYMQATEPAHLGGWDGTGVFQDLLDMNADGLPDLVKAPGKACGGCTTWNVWPNTGSGFGPMETVTASKFEIAFTANTGTVLGTFDINGDGLPDLGYSQRVQVSSTPATGRCGSTAGMPSISTRNGRCPRWGTSTRVPTSTSGKPSGPGISIRCASSST